VRASFAPHTQQESRLPIPPAITRVYTAGQVFAS
jgi:hypothetical protein